MVYNKHAKACLNFEVVENGYWIKHTRCDFRFFICGAIEASLYLENEILEILWV